MIFLYYLPTEKMQPELPLIHSLGGVFADVVTDEDRSRMIGHVRVVQGGPDGGSGLLIWGANDLGTLPETFVPGYYPDRQKWQKCGEYWIGFYPDDLPQPKLLERREMLSGYCWELGDGQWWQCPTIRRPVDRPNVPQVMGLDAEGKFTQRVHESWREAWEMSAVMWDVFRYDREITKETAWDYACKCLALNYRVSRWEVSLLGLITTTNYADVFKAAVDGPLIETVMTDLPEHTTGQKKTSPETSISETETSPIT